MIHDLLREFPIDDIDDEYSYTGKIITKSKNMLSTTISTCVQNNFPQI